jgi:hypothetical protein
MQSKIILVLIAHINGIENPLLGQALKNNKIMLALVLVQKMNLDLNTFLLTHTKINS